MRAPIQIEFIAWKKVEKELMALPAEVRPIAEQTYGNEAVGYIREYPPYKYVTRAAAYPGAPAGPGWFSDKQRRYVMAKIRKGEITPGVPNRSGTLARGWKFDGRKITNDVAYSPWVMGNKRQSNHEKLAGWQKTVVIINQNLKAIMKQVDIAVENFVKKKL